MKRFSLDNPDTRVYIIDKQTNNTLYWVEGFNKVIDNYVIADKTRKSIDRYIYSWFNCSEIVIDLSTLKEQESIYWYKFANIIEYNWNIYIKYNNSMHSAWLKIVEKDFIIVDVSTWAYLIDEKMIYNINEQIKN